MGTRVLDVLVSPLVSGIALPASLGNFSVLQLTPSRQHCISVLRDPPPHQTAEGTPRAGVT